MIASRRRNPAGLLLALALGSLALTACERKAPGGGDAPSSPAAGDPEGAPLAGAPTAIARGAGGDGASAATAVITPGPTEAPQEGGPTEVPLDDQPLPPPQTGPVLMTSPDYGIQAFLWWRPEVADRDLGLAGDMGFRWVKQIFGWRDIELSKGEFDWSRTDRIVKQAAKAGVQLLIRIDHQPEWARAGCRLMGPPERAQDLADFVTAVATRYRGLIGAYQIWNEPNLAREWCDRSPEPARYAELLQVSYAAIKAVDPRALVISAGLSPTGSQPPEALPDDLYLRRLYEAMDGSSDGHFDVLGVHAAGFAAPPETSPDEAAANPDFGGERFFTFRRVEDLRAIQEEFGEADKRVAVLEMGWTSDRVNAAYAWHAVSEEVKADYLARAYRFAEEHWQPWIGVMSTIYLCDQDWDRSDEQYWWCVNEPDGSPRPAYAALKGMPKVPAR